MTNPTDHYFERCDLGDLESSLPSSYYYDEHVFTSELEQLWYKQWIYVCRSDVLEKTGSYRTCQLGTQNIILLRNKDGQLRAFHNTCAHRGSILCEQHEGQLGGNRITCPYHRWSYSLDGELVAVPFLDTQGSEKKITLYDVALHEWGGNVYVNLDGAATQSFEASADPDLGLLANWPLGDLKTVHRHEYELACNWKVFWENFVECYHCPGLHPGLSRIVPLYRQSYTATTGKLAAAGIKEGLADGISSWTMDGKPVAPAFEGLTNAEKEQGHTFLMQLPTIFIVAHSDYVRQVSILPLGPEKISVRSEWLFAGEIMSDPGFDPGPAVDFVMQVLEEDARACELNQQGLKALAHKQGRLVPQEKDIILFHQWYREKMA